MNNKQSGKNALNTKPRSLVQMTPCFPIRTARECGFMGSKPNGRECNFQSNINMNFTYKIEQ